MQCQHTVYYIRLDHMRAMHIFEHVSRSDRQFAGSNRTAMRANHLSTADYRSILFFMLALFLGDGFLSHAAKTADQVASSSQKMRGPIKRSLMLLSRTVWRAWRWD
jgi:hypothetical protein